MDIDPTQALLWCVALTAHEIKWLDGLIVEAFANGARPYGRPSTIKHHEKAVSIGDGRSVLVPTEDKTLHPKEVNILIADRRDAIERLARYSKMAIDAGIAERVVKLAERVGELVAPILEGIFSDKELALTPKQRKALPEVTRRHLLEAKLLLPR